MLYVIFNSDGSIKYLRVGESIQQGDHLSKQLFAAIEGIRNTDYVCSVVFELPNGEINELVGTIDTQDIQAETIDFATVQYDGYSVKFTEAQTYLAGNLKVNLKLVDLQGVILCTYQVTLKINPTGYSPNDTFITESQYNSLLQSINSKYPTDVASKSWVNSVLLDYATKAWVIDQDYATEDWVSSRGFALLTDIPTNYVTLDTDQLNITGAKTFKGEINIDSLGSLKIWKTPTTAQDAANKGYVDSVVTGSIRFKGTVADLTALGQITGQVQGDEYWVTSESQYYIWNGTQWSAAGGGIDLSDYYTKDESNARYSLLNGSNTFVGNNGFYGITSFINYNGHSMVSISKDTSDAIYFYIRNSTNQTINPHHYTLGFENAIPSADRNLQLPNESGVLATRTWAENNFVKLTTNQDIYGVKKFMDSIKIGDDVAGHADNYIQLYNQDTQSYDILSGGTDGGDFSFPSINTSFGVAEDLVVLGDAHVSGDIIHYDDSEGEDLTFTFPNAGGTFATREWVQNAISSGDKYHIPIYNSGLNIASGNGVNNLFVPNAATNQSGVITTGSQSFTGKKTFIAKNDEMAIELQIDNDNEFGISICDKNYTTHKYYFGLATTNATHDMKINIPFESTSSQNFYTLATREWVQSQGYVTPSNVVTINTNQTVTGTKNFSTIGATTINGVQSLMPDLDSPEDYSIGSEDYAWGHIYVTDLVVDTITLDDRELFQDNGVLYFNDKPMATENYVQNLLTPSQVGTATTQTITTSQGTYKGFQFYVGSDRNGLYVFTYGYNMILLPAYGLQTGMEYKLPATLIRSGSYDTYVLTYRVTSDGYIQIYNKNNYIETGYTAYLFKVKLY